MCSICGITDLHKYHRTDPDIARRMTEVIRPRGPDSEALA
jgi:asparagine synthetase B (glutamine-hydrolysing)